MLKTLARAGAVLDLFTREQPELGVTEIARRLGMPKSNAHALVHSLCKIGLLRRTPGNRYALGWKIFVLSQRLLQSTELRMEDTCAVRMSSVASATPFHRRGPAWTC